MEDFDGISDVLDIVAESPLHLLGGNFDPAEGQVLARLGQFRDGAAPRYSCLLASC